MTNFETLEILLNIIKHYLYYNKEISGHAEPDIFRLQ